MGSVILPDLMRFRRLSHERPCALRNSSPGFATEDPFRIEPPHGGYVRPQVFPAGLLSFLDRGPHDVQKIRAATHPRGDGPSDSLYAHNFRGERYGFLEPAMMRTWAATAPAFENLRLAGPWPVPKVAMKSDRIGWAKVDAPCFIVTAWLDFT